MGKGGAGGFPFVQAAAGNCAASVFLSLLHIVGISFPFVHCLHSLLSFLHIVIGTIYKSTLYPCLLKHPQLKFTQEDGNTMFGDLILNFTLNCKCAVKFIFLSSIWLTCHTDKANALLSILRLWLFQRTSVIVSCKNRQCQ